MHYHMCFSTFELHMCRYLFEHVPQHNDIAIMQNVSSNSPGEEGPNGRRGHTAGGLANAHDGEVILLREVHAHDVDDLCTTSPSSLGSK